MSKARKPPPEEIYREEVHGAAPYNSTRQTFDVERYREWRAHNDAHPLELPARRVFKVGSIVWDDDSVDIGERRWSHTTVHVVDAKNPNGVDVHVSRPL